MSSDKESADNQLLSNQFLQFERVVAPLFLFTSSLEELVTYVYLFYIVRNLVYNL